MKWVFTADDAKAISDKLGAVHERGRSGREGVEFYYNGKVIVRFGIRRGSGDHGHNFIEQLAIITISLYMTGALKAATLTSY